MLTNKNAFISTCNSLLKQKYMSDPRAIRVSEGRGFDVSDIGVNLPISTKYESVMHGVVQKDILIVQHSFVSESIARSACYHSDGPIAIVDEKITPKMVVELLDKFAPPFWRKA